MPVVLFVGNISSLANTQYLERLFSAYGRVIKVEMFGEGLERYAEVTYAEVDDADTAVAALHWRYCSTKNVPLIVLYSRNSPTFSTYGLEVGEAFHRCLELNIPPEPVPLHFFDPHFLRNSITLPPRESALVDPTVEQKINSA